MAFLEVPDWGDLPDSFESTAVAFAPQQSFSAPELSKTSDGESRRQVKRRQRKAKKKAASGEQPAKMAKRQYLPSSSALSQPQSLVATRNWEVFDNTTAPAAMETTADAPRRPRRKKQRGKLPSSTSSAESKDSVELLPTARRGGNDDSAALPSPDLPSINDLTLATSKRKKRGKVSSSERLQGARFRMLNEKLYTTSGQEAFEWFSHTPSLFHVYHKGFTTQVERWPINPVDLMIQYLKSKPLDWVVADLGCGEAKIAASVRQKVHSFDLVAANSNVVACDIANVPLPRSSVDVCIFCLALMGVNYVDYLNEAHRILKRGGVLKITEVKSRITDFESFFELIAQIGFDFVEQNADNTHFIEMEFTKTSKQARSVDPSIAKQLLQPCIYKRR